MPCYQTQSLARAQTNTRDKYSQRERERERPKLERRKRSSTDRPSLFCNFAAFSYIFCFDAHEASNFPNYF